MFTLQGRFLFPIKTSHNSETMMFIEKNRAEIEYNLWCSELMQVWASLCVQKGQKIEIEQDDLCLKHVANVRKYYINFKLKLLDFTLQGYWKCLAHTK